MARSALQRLPLLIPLLLPFGGLSSVFDAPEVTVSPSPAAARRLALGEGVRVYDSDVSPSGPAVALLVANASGGRQILLWDVNRPQSSAVWTVPAGFAARSLAWHPQRNAIFVSGALGQQYVIQVVEPKDGVWTARQIYASSQEIRRLVPAPRPFLVGDNKQRYRLFVGVRASDGAYSIHSITEDGELDYQAVGRKEGFTKPMNNAEPSRLTAASALPLGFHPAGHLLLWEDEKRCFQVASYDRDHWESSAPLFGRDLCAGTVSSTPNGAGILHWLPGREGVDLYLDHGRTQIRQASGYQFVAAPSSVADGRGIVGVTRSGAGFAVDYVPIQVPLPDVSNAWMFLESGQDRELVARHGGLFRGLKELSEYQPVEQQLYALYDTELYSCGSYDESTPTRPYLVTTDSFWELYAAAYEGIFILRERQVAIPAFWQFVAQASQSLRQSHPQSRWTGLFAALAALQDKPEANPEAQRILHAEGKVFSPVLGAEFNYGELKPRGHYTSTPEAQRYFRAFRYLTELGKLGWRTDELRQLPPAVLTAALRWIGAYRSFLAGSHAPLVWRDTPFSPSSYIKHPVAETALFPLSWAFDNEVLFSTVYHPALPPAEQIVGPQGPRMLASSLDVPAALGNGLAHELLSTDLSKYPTLDGVLKDLQARFRPVDRAVPNLYEQWIEALAIQWADSAASPNGPVDERLWRVKRLQTGLASWATLRHATVLVNERSAAECGENGFEYIVMRPPRGYVEPDPRTFEQIAGLFDAAAKLVASADSAWTGALPDEGDPATESLKQGLLRRLNETAAKARLFQSIASKEIAGQPLTAAEYEEILYFGRVAEHHFLIFKSLANKDLALSTPNPIPKIADVAGGGVSPYLMAAVGRPLEWDHSVPFFGRHEIVKGAAYSFYEFASDSLLDDQDWIARLPSQPRPAWVAPFVSASALSCPALKPF